MRRKNPYSPKKRQKPSTDERWIWGRHAVAAALANPKRKILRLILAEGTNHNLDLTCNPETFRKHEIAELLPLEAVHQGFAVLTEPLPKVHLEDIISLSKSKVRSTILVLDKVTDPQNVGAIMRSASVFAADAVVISARHAPPMNGTLAKSSSGAIETVPLVRVTNLVRAIKHLKKQGFWCIGLDSTADTPIENLKSSPYQLIALGAEGPGLRRLTREACDTICKINSSGPISSLNVSNAAAVALFSLNTLSQSQCFNGDWRDTPTKAI